MKARVDIPGLLWFIILVNLLLKCWDLGSFSLSNDELSAVIRTQYDNFSTLIQEGVIRTDPHPAGIQIFLYYWIGLFNFKQDVFMIRLPFVLASTAALGFYFSVFRSWFGQQAALLIVGIFAFSEFNLIHGQLARPYAMALFSVALFLWSWNKIVLFGNRNSWVFFLYAFAALLSAFIA